MNLVCQSDDPTPRYAAAYVRVSTDEQRESGLGLEAQRAAILKCAASKGLTILSWHADEGISGAAPIEKRPGLLAALDALPRGGVMLVAKRDRLGRDQLFCGWLDTEAARKRARIVSAAGEGTDDDSPTSKLLRTLIDAFAEFERSMIRARTASAMQAKRARGQHAGGKVPYGWAMGADGKALVEDPHQQAGLALMRRLKGEGVSYRGIALALTTEGYPPQAAKAWNHKVVREILLRG